MSKGLVFWLLMVLWFVFYLLSLRPAPGQTTGMLTYVPDAFLFVLLFLLGWAIFGFVIQ